MDTPLPDIMAAIAIQLAQQLAPTFPTVQVTGIQNYQPSPPSIDVYPDIGVFMTPDAYGVKNRECRLIVRARVVATSQDEGQTVLLQLMDRVGPGSVLQALAHDWTFGGVVDDSTVDEQLGYGTYPDPAGQTISPLIGSEWHLRITL